MILFHGVRWAEEITERYGVYGAYALEEVLMFLDKSSKMWILRKCGCGSMQENARRNVEKRGRREFNR